MRDFNNYIKPKQITEIEDVLFSIGFNREMSYMQGFFTYKYDKWIATMEHKPHDDETEEIKFDLIKMEFLNSSLHKQLKNTSSVYELLFNGNKISLTPYKDILGENILNQADDYMNEYYEDDFNRFKNKVVHLLKDTFKAEIRKSKIKKLF